MKEDGCSNIGQNWDRDVQSILLAKVEAKRARLMEQAILCFVVVQLRLEQEMVSRQVVGEDRLQTLDDPDYLMPHSFLHLLLPPPPWRLAVLCRSEDHPSRLDILNRNDSALVVQKNKLAEAHPH